MKHATALVWFRRDLRLADNPMLVRALDRAASIAPLYVWPGTEAHTPGPAARSWLAAALDSLAADLADRGSSLAIREGSAAQAIARSATECGATLVACTRDWSPGALAEERSVATELSKAGVEFVVAESQLLVTPPDLSTKSGRPFSVFTPYYHAWRAAWPTQAGLSAAPSRLPAPSRPLATRDGPATRADAWPGRFELTAPGECAGEARLAAFVAESLGCYAETRDVPSADGTSALSPHLACGSISPARVASAAGEGLPAGAFVRQLAWREFAYHVALGQPRLLDEPMRAGFSAMGWRDDPDGLAAWKAGATGFPIVDAGMRQLAQTGWMHNRVRLLTASLLTKHLLVPWQAGAEHFERSLVDFDPVINAFNWQWVAGSGADAAPYFRIFNPVVQGERFDALGGYVRAWVPELADVPARWIHRPWAAPTGVLGDAGVVIGRDYPQPLVDLAEARNRALAAFSAMRAESR